MVTLSNLKTNVCETRLVSVQDSLPDRALPITKELYHFANAAVAINVNAGDSAIALPVYSNWAAKNSKYFETIFAC